MSNHRAVGVLCGSDRQSSIATPPPLPRLGVNLLSLARHLLFVASVLLCIVALPGCENRAQKLEAIYVQAGTNPAGASTSMATAYAAGDVTIQEMLSLAHDRIDKLGDATSVAFAGVVLDLLAKNEAKILGNTSVNEFLWIRIGTLAGNAAARARALSDKPAARALVLGGPARWQTENYWNQNPEHDALASIILFEAGQTQEALNRLSARTDISDTARDAQAYIRTQMARQAATPGSKPTPTTNPPAAPSTAPAPRAPSSTPPATGEPIKRPG